MEMTRAGSLAPPSGADAIPDARGLNLYRADPMADALSGLYLPGPLFEHLRPQLDRLGALAGGPLDELASIADKHPPTLSVRTRRGADERRIVKHPAYVELERVAFCEFGLAAMSHRPGVLGWDAPMPPSAKYALTYLLVQAEFGLCCPVSMTDSLARTLRRYGDPALVERVLPLLTATDLDAHPSILLRDEQDRAVIDALSTGLPGIGDADRILLDLLRLRGRHDEHRDLGSLARLQVHEALDQARTLVGLQQPGGIDHRGIVGRNRLQPALSRSRLHRRRPEGQRGEQQHGPQQPGEEGLQGVAGRLSRPAQAR
jgi:hypothetical protein